MFVNRNPVGDVVPGAERNRRRLQSSTSHSIPRSASARLWYHLSGQREDPWCHLSQCAVLKTTHQQWTWSWSAYHTVHNIKLIKTQKPWT